MGRAFTFTPLSTQLMQRFDAAGWRGAKPVNIGHNVWLGGHCVICPGVTVGDNSVIGAGSVVVRDIPANHVAVGNPCRVIREVGE